MLPTAHVASALLVNRAIGLDSSLATSVVGSLIPDAVDKTLAWVLGVTPAARHIGHSLLAGAAVTAVAGAVAGRRKGAALGVAYMVHLVGDLWHDGHVPWFMPFRRYQVASERWRIELSPQTLLLEATGAAVIFLLSRGSATGD